MLISAAHSLRGSSDRNGWPRLPGRRPFLSTAWVFALILVLSIPLQAEYYEYIDENGVKTFTDDRSQIPTDSPKPKVHKETLDNLDEAEKQQLLRIQNEAIERRKQEQRDWLRRSRQQEEAERKRALELERRKRLEALKTPVTIMGNLIIVQVTLKKAGSELTVPLLLDTGASITAINSTVAEQLNLTQGKKSAARIAGGGILRTKIVRVDTAQVGPNQIMPMNIMVLPDKGRPLPYQGLLGQNFLRHFHYTLDYNNRVIRWAAPKQQ